MVPERAMNSIYFHSLSISGTIRNLREGQDPFEGAANL
jgi:hypothetical protein